MTIERDNDPDATLKMPLPLPQLDTELEDIDPEQTLVREEWDAVAPRPSAPE